jgi:hypothetical protein
VAGVGAGVDMRSSLCRSLCSLALPAACLFCVRVWLCSVLNAEEQGSTMAFLRRGYKTSTWFEDETELEQYKDWRL